VPSKRRVMRPALRTYLQPSRNMMCMHVREQSSSDGKETIGKIVEGGVATRGRCVGAEMEGVFVQ
jgi:hypothetical protein